MTRSSTLKRKLQDSHSDLQLKTASSHGLKRSTASPDFHDRVVADILPSIYDDPMIDAPASDSGDEEEEPKEEGDVGVTQQTVQPTSHRPTQNLYKAPTLAEMDALRSADVQGGTAFSLQLDAFLTGAILPASSSPSLKSLLSSLHDLILALPPIPLQTPRKAINHLKLAPFALPCPSEFDPLKEAEVKWGLGWEQPEEVFVGGSWGVVGGYKRGKGSAGAIDMVAVLPSVRSVSPAPSGPISQVFKGINLKLTPVPSNTERPPFLPVLSQTNVFLSGDIRGASAADGKTW